MPIQKYYPTRAAGKMLWLNNFWHKLPACLVALGLSAQEVADRIADARWLVYLMGQWNLPRPLSQLSKYVYPPIPVR